MNKVSPRAGKGDRDTMRREYDFSKAVRGVTAARFASGTNVVVIDPELLDVFPDSTAVNEALRALAPVLRSCRRANVRHSRAKKSSAAASLRRSARARRASRARSRAGTPRADPSGR